MAIATSGACDGGLVQGSDVAGAVDLGQSTDLYELIITMHRVSNLDITSNRAEKE